MPQPPCPDNEAYQPQQIARRVQALGVTKAQADAPTLLVLGVLAGAFISLGALFFAVVVTGSELGFGPTRWLGGLAFCLGLALVVIAGAELFTGNNLLAMAWASRLITTRRLLRHWGLVYLGNLLGCLGTVVLTWLADSASLAEGRLGETLVAIAVAKVGLAPLEAFARGVLCNVLVCLAVWLAMSGHSVTDKLLAIVLPISAFVALGFEHSIANGFLLPMGRLLDPAAVPLGAALANLGWVTLGNLVGGTLLVAGVYWLAYLRPPRTPP